MPKTTSMRDNISSLALLCLCVLAPVAQAQTPAYLDPEAPLPARVADLESRMTLKEKISQIYWLQPAIPRIGILKYEYGNDAIHGFRYPGALTSFPQTIAQAASFDPEMVFRIYSAASDEARAKYNHYHGDMPGIFAGCLCPWSPTLNMVRDPRWGRSQETYGEDPWLSSRMGVANVKGLQGEDPKYLKTAACVKHFAGNNQENTRYGCNAVANERYWFEFEFPPYKACVQEANVQQVMTSYSAINGVPCAGNKWLVTDVLRGMWGFKGYVTSDCGAISNMVDKFKFVKTPEEAIAKSLNIGTDMECGGGCLFPDLANNYLEKAIAKKLTTEAVLNQALGRILTVKFKLGMFDPPDRVPYSKIATDVVASAEHFELARQAARESMVLLRNAPVQGHPLLPLDGSKIKTLAVVGPLAATCELGDYTAEGAAEPRVSPLMGLEARAAASNVSVRNIPWQSANMGVAAVNAARESDAVVALLGLNSNVATEGVDLKSIEFPREQQDFIEKIVAANPRTIVVLVNGNPLAINWINGHVPAILEAWYSGTQGGHAMADVLFGDFNPAGRLPMTFYASDKQLRPFDEYDITKGRTYMYLLEKPLYAFGYGLSYSTFKYENLVIPVAPVTPADVVAVTVDVTNTSQRDGDEVVQLYSHQVHAGVAVPIKQLRAFRRIHLKAAEKQTVKLSLPVKDLANWDIQKHAFVVDAGVFDLLLGASSDDIRQKGQITVK